MNDNNSIQTTRSGTGSQSCNGAGKRYAKLASLGQCAQCPMTAPCNNPCSSRPLKEGYTQPSQIGLALDANGQPVFRHMATGQNLPTDCGITMQVDFGQGSSCRAPP